MSHCAIGGTTESYVNELHQVLGQSGKNCYIPPLIIVIGSVMAPYLTLWYLNLMSVPD